MTDNLNSPNELSQIETLLYSIQPHPGEGFHRRMSSAPWNNPEPEKEKPFKLNRRAILTGTLASILLLLAVLGFTPGGKALADEIVHFFGRAAGNTLPLPPDQIQPKLATITPAPTYFPSLLSATQVIEQKKEITPSSTPVIEPPSSQVLDITTARSLAGFNLLEPAVLPADYRLQSFQYDPDQKAIRLQYASPHAGAGEFFSITQGKNLLPFKIGADAKVETIHARGKQIELVRGGWFVLDGATESTWEDDSETYTLRWQENDVTIMLGFYLNEPSSPAYLRQDDMIAIANGLTACQSTPPTKDYSCEVKRAAAAAGFTPWQFKQAPQGYTFKSVDYKPGSTAIWYSSAAGELGVIQSSSNFKMSESNDWFSVPSEAIQRVTVAGQAAEYVNGSFIAKPGEDHATWAADSGQIRLRWQKGEWWFQIVKWGVPEMQPQVLADLAAQLTAAADQIDGGQQTHHDPPSKIDTVYLSIDEIRKTYAKDFLQPAVLPDGFPFSHARPTGDGGILLFYGSFAADKMRITGPGIMLSQGEKHGSLSNAYSDYPPEAIKTVTIKDQPATLISGTLLTSFDSTGKPQGKPVWQQTPFTLSLYWETGDHFYFMQFYSGSESGARINQEDLIAIAESLQ